MQRCKFCGSPLPARARFCGSCGRTLYEVGDRATELSNTPTLDLPASEPAAQTPPIKPVRLQPLHDAAENQYPGATERYTWPGVDSEQLPTLADDQQNDEDEWQRRGMILGAPFLTMLAEDAQAPAGNVPMVQGTPQASGVPMVQGTPPAPANPPAGQLYVQNPAPSAPSTTPNAGSWMPHTPPPQHGTGEFTGHHQTHTPARHHVSGELAHHHVSGELPTGPLDTPHHHARSRRRHLHGPHRLISIVIVATIAVVVIVISGIGVGLAIIHPALSLSGSSSVVSGGTMSLHGSNFIPGSSVTLTLDNGLPVAYAGHGVTGQAGSYAAGLATAFQLSAADQLAQSTTTNASVPVNGIGSFDITIHVSESWSPGRHTIHAIDSVLGRSAELQFTVVPQQGRLELRPSTLDFGKLQKGTKAILSVVLSNTGKHPLTWQAALANAASTSWLKVQPVAGTIERSAEQFIYVIADTSSLKVGSYSATLDIRSDAGNTQVPVNLQVIQPGKPQAHLVVNPQTLDFGQLVAGNQATLPVTIGNVGTQALDWKATTGNASWLALDSNNGTVNSGGLPRVIQVTADPTGLAAGNYSATLSITSNGGSAQVTVTMVVINGPPPPPTLASSPGSFNVPGDSHCTYNASTGWTCVVSLSSSQSAQANLNWTASSSGVNGVTFSPASGTLSPGQTAQVSITIPNTACPAQADFTFTGPGNAANVLWSCAPPNLTATPATLSTGCLSCIVTLVLAPGSQGGLQWSTPSSGISGVTYNPASGTLLVGQTAQQVKITVPSTTCPTSTVFVFAGPVNTALVTWDCVPPKLTVKNITATQKVQFSGQVATVSDAAATDPRQLNATIDWGDGSSTPQAMVSGANGTFTVSDSHTYTSTGSFTISISVKDTTTGQTGKGNGTARVTMQGPTVKVINANSGPAAGGTSVIITGTNFTGATSVSFGTTAAASFTITSDTQITAISPPGSGTVDVTVMTPGGISAKSQADQFTYIPLPSVQSITPTSGPAAGGTKVTITGSSFTGATSVSFGSTATSNFTVDSDTQITAVSPPGSGTVDVTVTTPGGTSANSTGDQLSYIPPPSVKSVTPTSGPVAGGTKVTITGSNFTNATSVSFGTTATSNFTVDSDTQITAVSPPGSGTVDVTVTTLNGTSAKSQADQLSYIPPPAVTGINPASGPTTGGTKVTITGSNFTGATSVSFGTTATNNFTVDSDTQITVVSPAGSGTVDVTVTTPEGTSTASTADQFSYYSPLQ